MSLAKRYLVSLWMAACLTAGVIVTGCAVGVGYRSYDPYHRDYHRWDNRETLYDRQRAVEAQRDLPAELP